MRAVIQRVDSAQVSISGQLVSSIGRGLLALIGIGRDDRPEDLEFIKSKLLHLRIFPDDTKETALSLLQTGGELLLVSQFTLYADIGKGRRPSFSDAMPPEAALQMFEKLVMLCHNEVQVVRTGTFGAMMQVSLTNNGPYTIWVDSRNRC